MPRRPNLSILTEEERDEHRADRHSQPRSRPVRFVTELINASSTMMCCGEPRCICPPERPSPQPFRILAERLTYHGIVSRDIGQTLFAVDAATAERNAKSVFGAMFPTWRLVAVREAA